MTKGSHIKIKVLCDYCKEENIETIISKEYREYLKGRDMIDKDCCLKCQGKKEKEVNLIRFGVTSTALLPEIKNKQKETLLRNYGVENAFMSQEIRDKGVQACLDKYGVAYYTQTDEYKEKARQTSLKNWGTEYPNQSQEIKEKSVKTQLEKYGMLYCQTAESIEKQKEISLIKFGTISPFQNENIKNKIKEKTLKNYGVEHNSQSDIIKEKKKQTTLRNYGVEYYAQTDEFKERYRDNSLKKWGVEHPMQNKEFKNKIIIKRIESMYKNGTNISSSQQRYISELFDGELNYPVEKCALDIAFPNENIYVEYDGSGHDISVKYKALTEEEFKQKEINRQYFLKKKGWKLIRIISKDDKLPTDEVLLHLFEQGKQYINTGHSWINIDLSNNLIKCSQFEITYDFNQIINFIN